MALGGHAQARFQQTMYAPKTIAAGATGDGTITYDLGQPYPVSQITLSFFTNHLWAGGGKVEVDDGSGIWATVFDSGRGTALGSTADGSQTITFSKRTVRYIRVTDYFIPGVGPTAAEWLLNIEAL
jgi:hypothetical protein